MPLIVSHYSENTSYEQEVKNLYKSLKKYPDLEHWIEPIEHRGSWRANSNYCSVIIRSVLYARPYRDVLRVDADAVFQQYPSLFLQDDFKADVAAVVYDFPWHPHELMGGTLYFANNERVQELVDDWALMCTKTRTTGRPGDLLQELLEDRQDINFVKLPPTYCKIFDKMDDVEDAPVIEHFQASRRFRRVVNAMGLIDGTNREPKKA